MGLNRETAIRTAYFQALNGNLTYDGVNIPITDSIIKQGQSDSPVYIVLDKQTANLNRDGAFYMQSWNTTIDIWIVSKQAFSVSREIVDSISEQIENIITPDVTTNGLIEQVGYQINNVFLENVSFMEFRLSETQSIIPKVLTFSQKIVKQGIVN